MAGMRIGFAMGHPNLIRALNNVKYSYNSYTMNLPSLLAGVEAVKDKAYFESTLAKIVATRERSKKRLAELDLRSRIPGPILSLLLMSLFRQKRSLRH